MRRSGETVHAGQRLALLLAYDGTAYHGWQVQAGADTVQGALARALRPLVSGDVLPAGASRTDAGVHALGQVAAFSSVRPLVGVSVQRALNARLPPDVRVLATREVDPAFDPRRSARLKRYGYLLARQAVPLPFVRGHAWHVTQALDVGAMRAGLALLRGGHDFSAFRAAAGRDRQPRCTVLSARLVERRGYLGILVSADAFLHHMVRNIVGTLVEVGRGHHPPDWVSTVLAGRDRRQAGPTAPAHGLYLLGVRYAVPLFPGGGAGRSPRRSTRS